MGFRKKMNTLEWKRKSSFYYYLKLMFISKFFLPNLRIFELICCLEMNFEESFLNSKKKIY